MQAISETQLSARPAIWQPSLQSRFAAAERHLQEALALVQAGLANYQLALGELEDIGTIAQPRSDACVALTQTVTANTNCCTPVALDENECDRLSGILAARSMDPSLDGLTPREIDVLQLIASGYSNKEIARHLHLSVRTVERHITNLYRKIDAQNKADATAYALRSSLAFESTYPN